MAVEKNNGKPLNQQYKKIEKQKYRFFLFRVTDEE